MRALPWVAAVLVVLVVAGLFLLMDEGGEQVALTPVTATALPTSTHPLGEPSPGLPAVPESSRLALAAPESSVPAPPVEAMPESYRRALGGLRGRVIEEDGRGVPDLSLQLLGGGLHSFPPLDALLQAEAAEVDVVLGDVVTDVEGRFHFADLDPRVLGVLVLDPGGPRVLLHFLDQTPVTGAVRDLGDILLPSRVTLLGVVVDEREQPLQSVRVRAVDQPELGLAANTGVADLRLGGGLLIDIDDEVPPFLYVPSGALMRLERLLPVPTTLTDAEGRFEIGGVRPGAVTLAFDDGVHATLVRGPVVTGPAGGRRDLGQIVLEDGLSLEGKVVDSAGKPVPGARVLAGNRMVGPSVAILRPPVTSDEGGRFSVPGLRGSPARAVALGKDEDATAISEEVVPGAGAITLTLPAPRRLLLSVVDAGGAPVPGVVVHGRSLPDDDADEVPVFLIPPRPLDASERSEDGSLVVTGLEPGHWDLVVRAPGFAQERDDFDLRFADAEGRIVLVPERSLSVRVLEVPGDEPVEWALASVFEGDQPFALTRGRTDANGSVRLGGLADGEYSLEVVHPGRAVVSREVLLPTEEELLVLLPVGGRVLGYVVDNGAPPAQPVMVTLQKDDEEKAFSAGLPRMTLSDAEGAFRFDNVEPGEIELHARDRVRLDSLSSWWEPFAMTSLAKASVSVTAGGEVETVLIVGSSLEGIETGMVEGRLYVNGHPGASWKVRTWGKVRRSVSTAPDGGFRMGRLATGDVTLLFSAPGQSSMEGGIQHTHSLKLAAEAREFVEVSLSTGAVRGIVLVDADGRPVPGARVTIRSPEATGERWGTLGAVAGADGRFEIPLATAGSYVATADADGFARTRSTPFKVHELGTTEGVEVRLIKALLASGRVVLAGVEEQPTWFWMTAESDTGLEAFARVDLQDHTFAFDDLAPGVWTFTLNSNVGVEFEPVSMTLEGNRSDLELLFQPAQDDESKEEER